MCGLLDLSGRNKEHLKTVCKGLKSKFSWTSIFANGNYSIPLIVHRPSFVTNQRPYFKVCAPSPLISLSCSEW